MTVWTAARRFGCVQQIRSEARPVKSICQADFVRATKHIPPIRLHVSEYPTRMSFSMWLIKASPPPATDSVFCPVFTKPNLSLARGIQAEAFRFRTSSQGTVCVMGSRLRSYFGPVRSQSAVPRDNALVRSARRSFARSRRTSARRLRKTAPRDRARSPAEHNGHDQRLDRSRAAVRARHPGRSGARGCG